MSRTRVFFAAVISVALGAGGSLLMAAAQPGGGLVGTLTAATREEAVQCGRQGASCAVAPYELCRSDLRYLATLVTPFSRVAAAAMDAQLTGRPLGRMGPAAVNRWGISIQVSPKEPSAKPESIERIELRRAGRIIQSTKTTLGSLTTTTLNGVIRESTRGFFAFPAEAFEASADLDIVFFGSSGEATCRLDRQRLRSLR